MIQYDGGDAYTVKFPDGRVAKIPHVTDAIICLGSTTQGQGIWVNILEEAYGEIYKKDKTANEDSKGGGIGIDSISSGGTGKQTIALFTGKKTKSFSCKNKDQKLLKSQLEQGSREKKLMCARVGYPQKPPPGINTHHIYAILEYEANQEILKIWNPHGNTFNPKGPSGLDNGYPTGNGIFQIPFNEFIQIYSGFDIEGD